MSGSNDRPPTNPLRTSLRNDGRYQPPTGPTSGNNTNAALPRKTLRRRHDLHSHQNLRRQRRATMRGHFVAATGEYVGTTLFLWLAFAWHQTVSYVTPTNTLPASTTVLYISLGYGFSLLIAAFAFYRISGALFNPAVSLGMVITNTLPPFRPLLLVPAQFLGGMTAAGLVSCMFPGPISVVETTLSSGVSIAQGLFIEAFCTSVLIFTILMLAAEKSKITYLAPLGIGLSLFVAELAGVGYSGGSLNPARSLGPAVAARSFPGYFWIYIVGPFLGSLMAGGYYRFNKWFNYEEANPGQDADTDDEDPAQAV